MPASNSVRQNQAYLDSLHARLREKNERVVSLMRRKLGSSDAIMPAIREITETAATTLAVERTSLWLFNSDRSHLRCIDLYLRSTNEHSSGELLAADDLKAYLQSIESERIVVADNCLADPRTHEFADSYSRRHGISSMLDAGVWIDGAFSGILCHEHVGPPRKWEIDEILFVSSLADVAALSFEICELRHSEEQLAQRVDFKELLARLSTRFINSAQPNLNRALSESIQAIGEFNHVDWCALYQSSTKANCFQQLSEWNSTLGREPTESLSSTDLATLPFSTLPTILKRLSQGEVVTLHDSRTIKENEAASSEWKLFKCNGLRSILLVPMNETDSLRGFVALGLRRQPWHWSEDAVSLVSFASEMFLSVLKRQETEEILQAMRFAIDKASDSVFWISSSGEITYANESASNILGYSNAELLRMKIWEISASMLEDDWPKHRDYLSTTNPRVFESSQKTKCGEVFPVEITINLLTFRGEEFHCAFVRSISERKLTQQVLEKQRAFFRTVIDMNPNLIFAKDRRGRFVLVNQAVADAYGTTVEALVGKTDADFNSDKQEVAHYLNDDLAVMDSLAPKFIPEERLTDRNGKTRFLQTAKMPIVGKDGTANLILGVATDISDRKRAEEEQHRLTLQMQHAQKLESLGVLAGGIAHDFNNLLMAILGNVGLAATEAAPQSVMATRLEQINKAAKRAADLTNQLLAYSGKGRFIVERLDLSSVVLEMASLLETVLSKKASLSCQFAPNLPAVRADSSQIRQVIMNLITNASDALGEEVGEIHVATHVIEADRNFISQMYLNDNLNEGAYVCLEVRDSGCGMNIETLSRIFDPFFSTKFTGRGLGLAAVLGIVRSHGGGLSVWSSPSEGTTFKVLFPISELDPESVAERSCSSSLPITKVGEVLVVDDEDAARSVTRAMLEHFGFRVTEACDGVEALEVFKERGSDFLFVLLDMTMPRMDGIETYRELHSLREDLPVILTSGYSEEEATSRLNGLSVTGFLQKPYTPEILRKKVSKMLELRQLI